MQAERRQMLAKGIQAQQLRSGSAAQTAGSSSKQAPTPATPVKGQPSQANKRIREKTTPASKQTPSTKTPDAKHFKPPTEISTPVKQLFEAGI